MEELGGVGEGEGFVSGGEGRGVPSRSCAPLICEDGQVRVARGV